MVLKEKFIPLLTLFIVSRLSVITLIPDTNGIISALLNIFILILGLYIVIKVWNNLERERAINFYWVAGMFVFLINSFAGYASYNFPTFLVFIVSLLLVYLFIKKVLILL